MAAIVEIEIDQGSSFLRTLTLTDSSGQPLDLTGSSFASQARNNYSDASAAFSFTFTILNQTSNKGQVNMTLAPSVTQSLPITQVKKYVYDVEWTDATGKVTRLFQGIAAISPEATK